MDVSIDFKKQCRVRTCSDVNSSGASESSSLSDISLLGFRVLGRSTDELDYQKKSVIARTAFVASTVH